MKTKGKRQKGKGFSSLLKELQRSSDFPARLSDALKENRDASEAFSAAHAASNFAALLSSTMKDAHRDPELHSQLVEASRAAQLAPDVRARTAERARVRNRNLWKDPLFIAAKTEQSRGLMKARWETAEFRTTQAEKLKAFNAKPEVKLAARARMKAINADPAHRARQAAALRARYADPSFKARMSLARWGKK